MITIDRKTGIGRILISEAQREEMQRRMFAKIAELCAEQILTDVKRRQAIAVLVGQQIREEALDTFEMYAFHAGTAAAMTALNSVLEPYLTEIEAQVDG